MWQLYLTITKTAIMGLVYGIGIMGWYYGVGICWYYGLVVHRISQARILKGLPFSSPGDLLKPGVRPGSPALQADSLLTVRSRKHLMPSLEICKFWFALVR